VNSLKKFIPKVAALLALALLLAAGCADTPEDPDTNIRPDTFISSYNIDTSPDSASFYYVNFYWRASDRDGRAIAYRYWVDTGDSTETFDTNVAVRLEFPNSTTTYTFYVQAKDNSDEWDATPASRFIDITDTRDITDPAFLPSTAGVTVPPNGASTSRGVPFAISGTDVDGIVTDFQWALDDPTSWTSVTPDVIDVSSSVGTITLGPDTLTLGPHIVYFRAVDNMGNVDPSPLSVSINVEAGFAPELALSVRDGDPFVVPHTTPILDTLEITYTATVDFYYGAISSYYVSTSTGVNDTTTDASITLTDLSDGSYWIKVTANDVGGNSTADSVNFNVVALQPDQGILGINGVDWPTYSRAPAFWSNAVPFGEAPNWKWWDLFLAPPGGGRPFGDSLLGTGSVPTWMFSTTYFSAIAWMGNNYSGDQDFWIERQDEIMAYLNMGGHLILAARYGETWFLDADENPWDELNTYAGVDPDGWQRAPSGGWTLVAVADSLTDVDRLASQSLCDWATITGANTTRLYKPSDTDYDSYAAGFIAEPAGSGKFVFIAGREYRWDRDEFKANLDVIYRLYLGVY
jgi:hypothetical protein